MSVVRCPAEGASDRSEGLSQVVAQVVDVLQANRQPYDTVGDADSGAGFGPILLWVVVAGWVTRLLASPRLLEMSMTSIAFIARKASSRPPSISKVTMVPPPFIWRIASSCWGWLERPGCQTCRTRSWPSSQRPISRAFAISLSTRRFSVSRLLTRTHALNGLREGPV